MKIKKYQNSPGPISRATDEYYNGTGWHFVKGSQLRPSDPNYSIAQRKGLDKNYLVDKDGVLVPEKVRSTYEQNKQYQAQLPYQEQNDINDTRQIQKQQADRFVAQEYSTPHMLNTMILEPTKIAIPSLVWGAVTTDRAKGFGDRFRYVFNPSNRGFFETNDYTRQAYDQNPVGASILNLAGDIAVPTALVKGVQITPQLIQSGKYKYLNSNLYQNGTLWDKYTTLGGRFGYYGTPFQRFTGTIQRRFNFGKPTAVKPELLRKLNEPIKIDENRNVVVSGNDRFVQDGHSIPNTHVTTDRFVVGHRNGDWNIADGYIFDPEITSQINWANIEPSDMFSYGETLKVKPNRTTLISGNIARLKEAQANGIQTLSSPRLRNLYKEISKEIRNRAIKKYFLNFESRGSIGRSELGDKYAAEMQRLKSTRGNPTLEDYKLLEKETGLSTKVSGEQEIKQYNSWLKRLWEYRDNGTPIADIPDDQWEYTFPNDHTVSMKDVLLDHEKGTGYHYPTFTTPYNKVFYDPATYTDSKYRITHNIDVIK